MAGLKRRLTEIYSEVAAEGSPSETEVKQALSTLASAWGQVADSVTSALGDPATRASLKRAASSLATALGATITDLGAELRSSRATEGSDFVKDDV
jgi:hypothetical protein